MKAFIFLLFLLFGLGAQHSLAQFHTNSDARELPNACFEVTPAAPDQTGTVWTLETIDFNQPFDTLVWIMPGQVDGGGDGLVFAFHTGIISLGSYDGHLAYENLPSILGIEIDTHHNPEHGDPDYDHMALTRHGAIDHQSSDHLVGPVPLTPTRDNVEDGAFHSLRIRWRPPNSFSVYWDCQLLISYAGNIVEEIFGGNPLVRWGVAASTSQTAQNRHVICLSGQALNELIDRTICPGGQTQLQTTFQAETYQWTPATSLDQANIPNPIASPESTTTYHLLAIDECDQSFADTLTVFVEGDPIFLDMPADTTICHDNGYHLDATIPNATYLWSDGSTASTFSINESGLYSVLIQTSSCEATYRQQVTFGNPPAPQLPADTLFCLGATSFLDAGVSAGTYLWNDGSTSPTLPIISPGIYSLTISNSCGSSSASTQVTLEACEALYIPTAFSPNGDGLNDEFLIYAPSGLVVEQLQIFDRWGNQVFRRDGSVMGDQSVGWDGTFRGRPLPVGTYIYWLKFLQVGGERAVRSGEINLLR